MLASLTRRPTCRTALPLRPARGDAPWRCFPPGFMSRLMSWHSVAEAGVRGWSRCAFYRMASKEWHAGMNESSWAIIVRLSAGWRRVLAAHTPGLPAARFVSPFSFLSYFIFPLHFHQGFESSSKRAHAHAHKILTRPPLRQVKARRQFCSASVQNVGFRARVGVGVRRLDPVISNIFHE